MLPVHDYIAPGKPDNGIIGFSDILCLDIFLKGVYMSIDEKFKEGVKDWAQCFAKAFVVVLKRII